MRYEDIIAQEGDIFICIDERDDRFGKIFECKILDGRFVNIVDGEVLNVTQASAKAFNTQYFRKLSLQDYLQEALKII